LLNSTHSVCSVCATTVDNSGVYVYYLKGIVSVYFRCPARTVGFTEISTDTTEISTDM